MRSLLTILIILVFKISFSQCSTININMRLYDSAGSGITVYAPSGGASATFTSLANVTLRGWHFKNNASGTNGGYGLRLNNCSNITIDGCFFDETYERALELSNCNNITVKNSLFFNNNWGVVSEDCDGAIQIINNEFLGMSGERTGQGCCRGQAIYFIRSYGVGNLVYNNRIVNFIGESYQGGDVIAAYVSGGTSSGRMLIRKNIVWGWGPGTNGCGIIMGDATGAYIVTDSNKVLQGAITNIAVAGGNHIAVGSNKVWGERSIWSGGGYYAYPNPGACDSIKLNTDNKTWVIDKAGNKNDAYIPGTCSNCSCAGPSNLASSLATALTDITTGMPTDSRGLPGSLITFLCEDDYWKVRNSTTYASTIRTNGNNGTGTSGSYPPQRVDLSRPTANAGPDQSISTSTATLTASSSTATQPLSPMTGTNTITYTWAQVSGPNTASMSNSSGVTNNLSGLITGTYIFRLVVTQTLVYDNGIYPNDINYTSTHSDWVQVTTSSSSYRSRGRIF